MNRSLIFFTIVLFSFISSCSDKQVSIDEQSEIDTASTEMFNFEDYIEDVRSKYRSSDKLIAFEFEFVDDKNIKIKSFSALEGIDATIALATTNINTDFKKTNASLNKSSNCSQKDVSKGNCYEITCHGAGSSTTSKCTGGAFGSCLKKGKACLESGGCIELCKVSPRIYYIPPVFDEDSILKSPEQLHLFVGEN